MDFKLLVLLSLSVLAVSEKRMLRASSRARLRQIPLEIPLRVPLLVPLGPGGFEEAGQLPADGPLPALALQPDAPPTSMEMNGPPPMFAGMLPPLSDASREEAIPSPLRTALVPRDSYSDTTGQDAHLPLLNAAFEADVSPHTESRSHSLSVNEDEMLKELFDFGSILGAGLVPTEAGGPRTPLAADGVRVKTRPGHGVPSPLHLERRANQNFQLDFEPESIGEAKYQGSSGNFELVMNRPEDAAAPRNVHIAFEDAPTEDAVLKVTEDAQHKSEEFGDAFFPSLEHMQELAANFSKHEVPEEVETSQLPYEGIEPSHQTEDEQRQPKKTISLPLHPLVHDAIEPMHQLHHQEHAKQDLPEEGEISRHAEDEQRQPKKTISLPLHPLVHDAIEPMHQLHHQEHAKQDLPEEEETSQLPEEEAIEPSHITEDGEHQQKEKIALPSPPVQAETLHLAEDKQHQQKMVSLPLHRLSHDAIAPMHQIHQQAHTEVDPILQKGLHTQKTNTVMQARLAKAKDELLTAFEPLPEPLVMIEVDN